MSYRLRQMLYAKSFQSFVDPSGGILRLADWLANLPEQDLALLRSTIERCRVGEGARAEEDDLLILTQMHHVIEQGQPIHPDDASGWRDAFEDLQYQTRLEQHRRLGLNPSLMEALFHR